MRREHPFENRARRGSGGDWNHHPVSLTIIPSLSLFQLTPPMFALVPSLFCRQWTKSSFSSRLLVSLALVISLLHHLAISLRFWSSLSHPITCTAFFVSLIPDFSYHFPILYVLTLLAFNLSLSHPLTSSILLSIHLGYKRASTV